MIKNNRNMIFYIMFITSILLLISAYFICENNNKESEKYDIKVTKKHYYLHNNLELSTMEIKDEEIPLKLSTPVLVIGSLYAIIASVSSADLLRLLLTSSVNFFI